MLGRSAGQPLRKQHTALQQAAHLPLLRPTLSSQDTGPAEQRSGRACPSAQLGSSGSGEAAAPQGRRDVLGTRLILQRLEAEPCQAAPGSGKFPLLLLLLSSPRCFGEGVGMTHSGSAQRLKHVLRKGHCRGELSLQILQPLDVSVAVSALAEGSEGRDPPRGCPCPSAARSPATPQPPQRYVPHVG